MYDSKKIKHLLFSAALGSTMALSLNGVKSHADTTQSFKPYTPVAYDISEFQGKLSDQQVLNLKNEIKFVVLRIQDGQYHDRQVNNNIRLMEKYGVPYGVYSYSEYTNSAQAEQEAQRLHSLAPNASFYVNDFEIGFTNTSDQNAVSWANAMKQLTSQPVILYGSQSTLDRFQQSTLNSYSAVWLANYTSYTPNPRYNYDLWQFTDKYQSKALGKALDADTIPLGGRKLAFWTTTKDANGHKRIVAKTGTARHIKKHSRAKALHKSSNKKAVIAKTSVKKAKKLQYKTLSYTVKHHKSKKHLKRSYHIKKHAIKKIKNISKTHKYSHKNKKVSHKKKYKKVLKKHKKYSYSLTSAKKKKFAKSIAKSKKSYAKRNHIKKLSYHLKKKMSNKKMKASYKRKHHKSYNYHVKSIHHKHAKKITYRKA